MAHREMDAVQVDDTIVGQQPTLSPRFILLGERVVEAADCTGTGGHSREGCSDLPDFVGTHPAHKHLGQGLSHLRFVTVVALEHLAVKLAFPVSGTLEILNTTSRSDQVTGVGPIAIPTARGRTFPPRGPNATRPVLPA